MSDISPGDAGIHKPHLELVKLAADSVGLWLNVWFLFLLLGAVIGPLAVIWVRLQQPERLVDHWPWYAALALVGPISLAYILRWLSKGVIERRTVRLILVGLALFLFGILLLAGPQQSMLGSISLACIAFVYAALLVIALIAKV
jgi:hypothetical protein